jgi:hypothetical protein
MCGGRGDKTRTLELVVEGLRENFDERDDLVEEQRVPVLLDQRKDLVQVVLAEERKGEEEISKWKRKKKRGQRGRSATLMCCLTMATSRPSCLKRNLRNALSLVRMHCRKGGMICGRKGMHFRPSDLKISITAWITVVWC